MSRIFFVIVWIGIFLVWNCIYDISNVICVKLRI